LLPVWANASVTSQLSISKPRMHGWFSRWNTTERGRRMPYDASVKPFNFLTHPVLDPLSADALRTEHGPVSLIAPFSERREFVNRHDPSGPVFRIGEGFTPRTYADLICAYDRHPERKFAGPDGMSCRPATIGLLFDLPIVAKWVRLVGKEANEIEQIDAGLMETEAERMIVYEEGEWSAIRRVLRTIPTKDLQRITGYSRSMVKYLKNGARKPNQAISSLLLRYRASIPGGRGSNR
jgi:hypothetical protein